MSGCLDDFCTAVSKSYARYFLWDAFEALISKSEVAFVSVAEGRLANSLFDDIAGIFQDHTRLRHPVHFHIWPSERTVSRERA